MATQTNGSRRIIQLSRNLPPEAVLYHPKEWMEFDSVTRLTPRQAAVLRGIALGLTNEAIARVLTIGLKSAENYIHAIYQEFNWQEDFPVMWHPRVCATLELLRHDGHLTVPLLHHYSDGSATDSQTRAFAEQCLKYAMQQFPDPVAYLSALTRELQRAVRVARKLTEAQRLQDEWRMH